METRNQSAVLNEFRDDAELIGLATPPAQLALPILRKSAGMFPLVVLLALLPGVWAVMHAGLSDMSALWGLRSLELVDEASLSQWFAPGSSAVPDSVRFAPPLANWCTALSLWGFGIGIPGLLFPAWIFVGGAIGATFGLAQRLGGNRAALLTTLVVGCHGEILRLAQEPSPYAAGVCFGLCTIWAAAEHWHKSRGMISLQLLFGGLALGLCLLASGLFVAVVLLPLVLLALSYSLHMKSPGRAGISRRRLLIPSVFTQPAAIVLLAVTAFAVGGWWEMMMLTRFGWEFASGYSQFFPGTFHITGNEMRHAGFLLELTRWTPFMLGFGLLGIWQAIRELNPTAEEGCDPPRFLLLWTAAGILCWSGVATYLPSNAPPVALCRAFALIPVTILAARGILSLADRQIRWEYVLGVLVLEIACAGWGLRQSWGFFQNALFDGLLLFCVIVPLLATVMFAIRTHVLTDVVQRRCLSAIIVTFLGGSCLVGLRSVSQESVEANALWAFGADVRQLSGVTRVSLLTRVNPPPQIQFLARGVWPKVPVKRFHNWTEALEGLPQQADPTHLFIVWNHFEVRGGSLPETATIRPVATTRLYRGRELNAYLLSSSPLAAQPNEQAY